jgi:hypothetical protein
MGDGEKALAAWKGLPSGPLLLLDLFVKVS